MFDNLKKINLEKYLAAYAGYINKESWLIALDDFVGTLTQENINVLQSKINPEQDPYRINDLVNEIMVACVYHNKAIFIKESNKKSQNSFDLFDENSNLKIEIKSLNEGEDETDRHKKNEQPYGVVKALTGSEKQELISIIKKKCVELLEKAVEQIEGEGKIYLIWDYNIFTSNDIGTQNEPKYTQPRPTDLKDKFPEIVEECVANFTNEKISIKTLLFSDLQNKVAQYKI